MTPQLPPRVTTTLATPLPIGLILVQNLSAKFFNRRRRGRVSSLHEGTDYCSISGGTEAVKRELWLTRGKMRTTDNAGCGSCDWTGTRPFVLSICSDTCTDAVATAMAKCEFTECRSIPAEIKLASLNNVKSVQVY